MKKLPHSLLVTLLLMGGCVSRDFHDKSTSDTTSSKGIKKLAEGRKGALRVGDKLPADLPALPVFSKQGETVDLKKLAQGEKVSVLFFTNFSAAHMLDAKSLNCVRRYASVDHVNFFAIYPGGDIETHQKPAESFLKTHKHFVPLLDAFVDSRGEKQERWLTLSVTGEAQPNYVPLLNLYVVNPAGEVVNRFRFPGAKPEKVVSSINEALGKTMTERVKCI